MTRPGRRWTFESQPPQGFALLYQVPNIFARTTVVVYLRHRLIPSTCGIGETFAAKQLAFPLVNAWGMNL